MWLCRAATVAVRAAALHHRALTWAYLMKCAILPYSICLALVTPLPTALTKLTWTNCLEVRAGSVGQECPCTNVRNAFRGDCLAETDQVAGMHMLKPEDGWRRTDGRSPRSERWGRREAVNRNRTFSTKV